MDSLSKKITSRPGFSKAILVIRKIDCSKEGKKLLSDDGLHCFRYECSDCNRTIVEWIRLLAFFGIGMTWASFQEFRIHILSTIKDLFNETNKEADKEK